jgi:S-adenosylmethionine decarboxylase
METYVCQDDKFTWYGKHILLDMWKPSRHLVWADSFGARKYMEMAAKKAGATVLHSYFHDFGNGGVSGAVILAESHISFHSWPEEDFVAIDIFMCGKCDPNVSLKFLCDFFQPVKLQVSEHRRGLQYKPKK